MEAALPAAPAEPWEPVAAQPQVGWEQRLGARAFVWVGAVTLALAAVFLVRYSIEEGYLSPEVRVILAALFGFALIGAAERMRSRDDRVAQALAAAGVASLYGALVRGGRALRHDLQGRGRRWRRGADRLRDRRLPAPRHLRRGPRLRRRLRQPRDHRQRDAQHAGPVRLSAGDRRRHPGRHPPARLVAARLGRPAGIGDVDAALDVVAGGRPALGRVVPGRRRRPVRLGDLAAVGRKREPDRRRCAAGLGGARRHRRPDRGPDLPGQWQAERRLAGAGGAWPWPVCARPLDAALPVRCRPGAGPVGRSARPVVGRHAGHRAGLGQRGLRLAGDPARRLLRRGRLRPAVERGPAGLLGGARRRRHARALPALLVRAARRRRRNALGPDQCRARRTLPGRRRAAGTLARDHARRHRGAGLLRGGRRLLHRRRHRARVQPRMDHGGLCRRVRRRGRDRQPARPQRHAPAVLAAARRRGRALRAQSRGAEIPARRHPDLQLDPVGLRPRRSRPSSSACASCGRPATMRLVRATEAAIALLAFVLLTLEVRSVFRA